MQLLRLGFNILHGIGHNHRLLTRGHERIILCGERWPFGKVVINYQPNPHAPWQRLRMDEFTRALTNREWTQHG